MIKTHLEIEIGKDISVEDFISFREFDRIECSDDTVYWIGIEAFRSVVDNTDTHPDDIYPLPQRILEIWKLAQDTDVNWVMFHDYEGRML